MDIILVFINVDIETVNEMHSNNCLTSTSGVTRKVYFPDIFAYSSVPMTKWMRHHYIETDLSSFDDIFVMDPIGSCHCTTFGVASDNDFVKMIVFPFQCIYSEGKSWYTPISTAPEQHFNNTMMTSSNGNISRITGLLWGELTGHRWTPPPPPPPPPPPHLHTHTKAIDGELWYFLWSAPE